MIARRRSEEKLSTTGATQWNLGLPLPPDSLDLNQTQKQKDEILNSSPLLDSLSNTTNETVKN